MSRLASAHSRPFVFLTALACGATTMFATITATSAPLSAAATPSHSSAAPTIVDCSRGSVCLWEEESYSGRLQIWDLRSANPGECIRIPDGRRARSLGNRMDRDLTIYRDAQCTSSAGKEIYPGGGTYTATSPFPIAAITIAD